MMKAKSYVLMAACLSAATLFAPMEVRADIFAFTDERGVMHFTNVQGLDRRYKLIRKENAPSYVPSRVGSAYMPSEAEIKKYGTIIDVAARTHGVDSAFVHAVVSAESGFNPRAISPKGASGLMQLMPATAQRYGVKDIMDPVENIQGGVRYLKDLLAMFNGNAELAAAGYNAGENAVIRHGNRIPPYAETVNYVPKVMDYYRKFQARKG